MPRPLCFPSYPRDAHASGRARISVQSKTVYLPGPHGSAESHVEYARLKAEWHVQRQLTPALPLAVGAPKTINDLLARFWDHAEVKYRTPDGEPSSELVNLRYTLRSLRLFYGHTPVHEFGPLALKALRRVWIAGYTDPQHGQRPPWTRKSINRNVNRIRLVFSWAESEELVPASTLHRLRTVRPLEVGEFGVLETDDVLPVPDLDRRRTLRHINPVVADLIRVQYLSGARPGEIVALRPCDLIRQDRIDLGGGVTLDTRGIWVVRPEWHKTRRKGHRRIILLGPKAQAVLAPYLLNREATAYIFSPVDARATRFAEMRSHRKTPVQPSQENRGKATPKRRPRAAFTVQGVDAHIARACRNHGIQHWSAHQLRHSAATALCEQFGLELAQTVLGHRALSTTRLYALDNLNAATAAMREVG